MKKFVETPLFESALEAWVNNCEGVDCQALVDPDIREAMLFQKDALHIEKGNKHNNEHYSFRMDDGSVIEYHQTELESVSEPEMAVKGVRHFREYVRWTKGAIEQDTNHDFYQDGGRLFIGSEEGIIDYDELADDDSVSEVLERVRVKYAQMESTAEGFAEGFQKSFDDLQCSECDDIYFLGKNRFLGYKLVKMGGKRFIERASEGDDRQKALFDAYMQFRPRILDDFHVDDFYSALGHFPQEGKIALFTSMEHMLKLIGSVRFDLDEFMENRFVLGEEEGLEVRIANHRKVVRTFLDSLFCADVYELLQKRYPDKTIDELKAAKSLAEDSAAVKKRRQLQEVFRKLQKGVKLEDVLPPEGIDVYRKLFSEFNKLQDEIRILDDYNWWDEFKGTVGLQFEGPIDHVHFRGRTDWPRIIEQARARSSRAKQQMRSYSRFLHISPERHPKAGQAYPQKRKGIGNLIIDFNGESDEGHNAYLFKGRILQPMLDRILPPQGKVVALDTCADRVEELLNFCELEEDSGGRFDRQTLVYKGVYLVMVNREAIDSVEKHRRKVEQEKIGAPDSDELAELVLTALNGKDEKDPWKDR